MKHILLFGAGKSATVLIDYLLKLAPEENWFLSLVDARSDIADSKLNGSQYGKAIALDIAHNEERGKLIDQSDIVISLLPPVLHILVARDCIRFKKNLLTASYVDDAMRSLDEEARNAGVLFLCELGLDPGIDHMSAKRIIDEIVAEGGNITSFLSHCGGLVAPESDDNPWHYKVSWNPRNIVLAGKQGAIYKRNGRHERLEYNELFAEKRFVNIEGLEPLCWYPNRDSLGYAGQYGIPDCPTFIRTTLRHPDFIYGWHNVVQLGMTDEQKKIASKDKSLHELFKAFLDRNGFSSWLEQKLHDQFSSTKQILAELARLTELEGKAAKKGIQPADEFMLVDDKGQLQELDIEDMKLNAASLLAERMHDAKLTLKQLFYLGMDDKETKVKNHEISAADLMQFAMERKLALKEDDRDMVVMLHEIGYEKNGESRELSSSLIMKGTDATHTAMAKTVGLPLGIAASLMLRNVFTMKGVVIPIHRELYEPILLGLESEGIVSSDEDKSAG